MDIRARVSSRESRHEVMVSTNGQSHTLDIPPKDAGFGSSVNGGELLALALATCYCNDLFREAAVQGIEVISVEVEVDAEFGGVGEAAREIRYRTSVSANAPADEVRRLAEHTDRVAEVQNTLRLAMPVQLESVTIRPAAPFPPAG